MGIRLVVVDDNPHVTWNGRVHPVNATFQQFVAGLLDLPGGPVASITSCVPLRDAAEQPVTLPLDQRIRVVGTAPFDGIAGYLRHLPTTLAANRPILRRAIAEADLVWIKVPASNALLAASLAGRAGVSRFGYVAGSARAVARGRGLGLPAWAAGLAYDVMGRLAGGRHQIVVGRGLVDGDGIVTSLVEPDEIRDVGASPWPAIPWRLRLAWAGRLAPGKGLEVLLDALALLVAGEETGHRVELVILGDGPARGSLEAHAAALGIGDRIHWLGHVADRPTYLDALASCDLFVFPSPAEGFPKVVLDAFAVGLPVVATPSGTLAELGSQSVELVSTRDPLAIAKAIQGMVADPSHARDLRVAGSGLATSHTRGAEASRLVVRWRAWYPRLPLDSGGENVTVPAGRSLSVEARSSRRMSLATLSGYPPLVLPTVVFWGSVTTLGWVYLGYPALVALLARSRPVLLALTDPAPTLTVAIAVHDEAEHIEDRIDDVLAQTASGAQIVEVLVGSDGSMDATDRIVAVRAQGDPRIRLLALPRGGQTATQTALFEAAHGEVVVLTDAETRFAPGCLAALDEAMRDPRVGCATGRLEWRDESATATSAQEGLYWRYERRIRELESRAGLLTAVTGALLAVRRSMYRPVPPTASMDHLLPLYVRESGGLVVYVPNAVATDRPISGLREQFRNRTRTATRGIRANLSMAVRLTPWRLPGPALAIWSHKILRWATPWFVLVAGAAGLALGGPYLSIPTAIAGGVVTAGAAHLLIGAGRRPPRAVAFARSFAVVNLAFALSWLNVLRGRGIEVWHRAEWRVER